MRQRVGLTGAAAIALLGAACSRADADVSTGAKGSNGSPVQIAARLDCPEREGDLRLQSAAADGRACAYRDENGAEVELRLAAADTLPGLESELKALIPGAAVPPEPPTPPRPLNSGTKMGVAKEGDRKEVRLPGLKIDAEGDRASVHMPGVHIEAEGERADVRVGSDGDDVTVRAHNGGAEIRVAEAAGSNEIQSTFLVTSDKPGPAGWRVAGYQARGPQAGPVILGVLRVRTGRHNGLMDDMEDLMDRNVRN